MRLVGEDAVVGMAGFNADRHCTNMLRHVRGPAWLSEGL